MNQICSATNNSGNPCKRFAISGGSVCPAHGGSAPAVKQRAAERIRELLHPALARLAKLIESEHEQVALGAVKSVLAFIPPEMALQVADEIPSTEQVREWINQLAASGQPIPLSREALRAEIDRLEIELGETETATESGWRG